MATTTVSDYVIWTKHIHGDAELVSRVHTLWAGATLQLEVDGVRGVWRKMNDGADGRPTPGIRPIGSAQAVWRSLFKQRRGEAVTIRAIEPYGGSEAPAAERRARLLFPPLARTEEQRQAALERLLNGWKLGYRSDGPYGPRDELYDRE